MGLEDSTARYFRAIIENMTGTSPPVASIRRAYSHGANSRTSLNRVIGAENKKLASEASQIAEKEEERARYAIELVKRGEPGQLENMVEMLASHNCAFSKNKRERDWLYEKAKLVLKVYAEEFLKFAGLMLSHHTDDFWQAAKAEYKTSHGMLEGLRTLREARFAVYRHNAVLDRSLLMNIQAYAHAEKAVITGSFPKA